MAATDSGTVHENFDLATDENVTFSRGDPLLELTQFREPLRHERLGNLAVEVGRVGTLLAGEGEEPGTLLQSPR